MPAGSIREIPTGAYFQDIFINISVKVLHPVARRVPEGGVHEKKMFKFWPLTRFLLIPFFGKLLKLRFKPSSKRKSLANVESVAIMKQGHCLGFDWLKLRTSLNISKKGKCDYL